MRAKLAVLLATALLALLVGSAPSASASSVSPAGATTTSTSSDCADAILYPTRAEVPERQGTNINYDVTGCDRLRASSDPFNKKWDGIYFGGHPVGHPLIYWFHAGVYRFVLQRHWTGAQDFCGKYWCTLHTKVTVVAP